MLPQRMSLLQRRFGVPEWGGWGVQPHIGSRGIDLSCKQAVLLVPNLRPAFSFLVEAKTGWPLASCKWTFGYEQGSCDDINDWWLVQGNTRHMACSIGGHQARHGSCISGKCLIDRRLSNSIRSFMFWSKVIKSHASGDTLISAGTRKAFPPTRALCSCLGGFHLFPGRW